jgi:hypothetical protein
MLFSAASILAQEVQPRPSHLLTQNTAPRVPQVEFEQSPNPEEWEYRECTDQDKKKAVSALEKDYPIGYRNVFKANPKSFLDSAWWTSCVNAINVDNIVVAIHETVHHLGYPKNGKEIGQYLLLDGKELPFLLDRGFFPPHLAGANQGFPQDTLFRDYMSYTEGIENAGVKFPMLLDELNAYSHGLATANAMKNRPVYKRQWRRGTMALMSYLAAYAKRAEALGREKNTWKTLSQPANLATIRTLYGQAEKTVEESCSLESDGEDRVFIKYLCQPENNTALANLLGRSLKCFSHCRIGK